VTCKINVGLYVDLNMLPTTHQYNIEQYRNLVNNEVETHRRKQPLSEYEVLSWHLPGKDCSKLKNFCHESQSVSWYLNLTPSQYKADVLPTGP